MELAQSPASSASHLDDERLWNRRRILVAALCLVGAAASSYKLYLEITAGVGAGLGKPLGRMARVEEKVRRKTATSFVWGSAISQEPVYMKDSIQTGDSSAAVVRFDDGTTLEIAENSLVVIDDLKNLSTN